MPLVKPSWLGTRSFGTDAGCEPKVVFDDAPPPYTSPYGRNGGFSRPYQSLFPCDAARVEPFRNIIARSLATRYYRVLPKAIPKTYELTDEDVEIFTQLHKATKRYMYGLLDASETLDLCARLELHVLRPADELHISRL